MYLIRVIKLVLFLLVALCLLADSLHAKSNLIDLRPLYSRFGAGQEGQLENGNFVQMTDGTILFFHPRIRDKFRLLLDRKTPPFSASFLMFSTGNPAQRIVDLEVKESVGTLSIGAWRAPKKELDRLSVSPEFPSLYKYCRSLFPGSSIIYSGVCHSSFIRLQDSQFLITGGSRNGFEGSITSDPVAYTATVYDVLANKVLKSFRLKAAHELHTSMLLPDGKVLLVGGRGPLEIVDVKHSISRALSSRPICDTDISSSTFCLDHSGNCLVFGNIDQFDKPGKAVQKVDLAADRLSRLPDLTAPRCYMISSGVNMVSQNAVLLKDNSVLLTSGYESIGGPMNYRYRQDVEHYVFGR